MAARLCCDVGISRYGHFAFLILRSLSRRIRSAPLIALPVDGRPRFFFVTFFVTLFVTAGAVFFVTSAIVCRSSATVAVAVALACCFQRFARASRSARTCFSLSPASLIAASPGLPACDSPRRSKPSAQAPCPPCAASCGGSAPSADRTPCAAGTRVQHKPACQLG